MRFILNCRFLTDVAEYLEPVVPAYRLAEAAKLLESYKVEELMSMQKEDILEHVNVLQDKLTFEARFLYRYLQAAAVYFGTYRNFCCSFVALSGVRRRLRSLFYTQFVIQC